MNALTLSGRQRAAGSLRFAHLVLAMLWFAMCTAIGCGDDADSAGGTVDAGADGGAEGTAFSVPETALEVASTTACSIDEECAADLHCFQGACVWECDSAGDCQTGDTCSGRRRCELAEQDGAGGVPNSATPEVVPDAVVVQSPPEIVRVEPGQTEITVTVKTQAPVARGVIGYTLETYSYGTREAVRPSQVFRAHGTDTFELVVPTSTANPDATDSSIVEVQLVTSVGSFRMKLQPKPSVAGRYAGTVKINRFGPVGLPIDFEIVTDPEGAELDATDHVYLVLPVAAGNIYSPQPPAADGTVSAVRAELTFQEFDQTWVATVRAPFAFAAESLLARYGSTQVIRGLRFQLTRENGILGGTVRDTWEGLYDARTSDGVASTATTVFQGKLDLDRVGPARALADLPAALATSNQAAAAQALPDVAAACMDAQFTVPDVLINAVNMTCAGITSAATFTAATSAERTSCAIAVAENALDDASTTAAQIAAFLAGTDPGTESFAEFMTRCAAGTAGACRPTADVLCGRELTAYAAATQLAPDANFSPLFDAYVRSTREAFLGRQLAAYQADADMRLAWLKSQDYPAIVTAAVRDLSEQLIDDWRANVLDAHFGSLSGQYDGSGLAVLARQVQGVALIDQRQLMLMEMTQSWRSAMQGLTVAARRWNDVYQDTTSRTSSAAFVSQQAFDLYVLSGLVDDLNVAAGSAYASFGLAAGFSNLLHELRRLTLPFSALIFDRDAEVVVSRSLNPLSTDDTLLSEIQTTAMEELDSATTMVNAILERAQEMAVDEQLLRNDLNNQIDAQFDELITLCGLPVGCANSDRELPECWPSVEMGTCGFAIDVENQGTALAPALVVTVQDWGATSDAGEVLLDLSKAESALTDSQIALASYREVTEQMFTTNDTRSASIDALIAKSEAVGADVQVELDKIKMLEDMNITAIETAFDQLKMKRDMALMERRTAVENVNNVRSGNTTMHIRDLRVALGLSQTSSTLRAAADRADTLTQMFAEGMPDTPDDIGGPLKASIMLSTYGATSVMDVLAQGLEVAAAAVENESEARNLLSSDMLEMLNTSIELTGQMRENEIANIEGELEKATAKNDLAKERAQAAVDLLWAGLEYDTQLERDLAVLYDRRDDIKSRITGEYDRSMQVQQANYTVLQKRAQYAGVVQRAQLLDGRLRNLVEQRKLINKNLGSPSVVFGWASQLEQAETRLDRAKDKMMEWVVALEYLAVRPFMDARMQILLARNVYQLAEIATSLSDIQGRCGGAINSNTSTISLRDDIMGLDASLVDPATGNVLSPAETFRAIMQRGSIPVDTRVRFGADSTIGDLVAGGTTWAASFDLSLSDFANLAASCNAKVEEIAIELVGTDLGTAQPTVGLAYDGTSSVRSCQPDIEDIVASIGRDATAFSSVTLFRTPGRVLAPTAGINELGEPNRTLVGLPLASQYTVIIDPTLGENASINWNNLEDVRIQVRYGYQDFYPEGQCF